jgi:hypothetical protein
MVAASGEHTVTVPAYLAVDAAALCAAGAATQAVGEEYERFAADHTRLVPAVW